MPQAENLSVNLHDRRLDKPLHTKLFKIAVGPYIVVSLEEIHIHPGLNQPDNRSKYFYISFRDHITVFIPEIPDVTQKIQSRRLPGVERPQKFDKTAFAPLRVIYIQPQMHIRYKICEFSVQAQTYWKMKISTATTTQ